VDLFRYIKPKLYELTFRQQHESSRVDSEWFFFYCSKLYKNLKKFLYTRESFNNEFLQ